MSLPASLDLPSLHSSLLGMFPGCTVVLHFSQAFPSIGSAGIEFAVHPNSTEGQEVVRNWFESRGTFSAPYGEIRTQRHWAFTDDAGIRFIGFWNEKYSAAA